MGREKGRKEKEGGRICDISIVLLVMVSIIFPPSSAIAIGRSLRIGRSFCLFKSFGF